MATCPVCFREGLSTELRPIKGGEAEERVSPHSCGLFECWGSGGRPYHEPSGSESDPYALQDFFRQQNIPFPNDPENPASYCEWEETVTQIIHRQSNYRVLQWKAGNNEFNPLARLVQIADSKGNGVVWYSY